MYYPTDPLPLIAAQHHPRAHLRTGELEDDFDTIRHCTLYLQSFVAAGYGSMLLPKAMRFLRQFFSYHRRTFSDAAYIFWVEPFGSGHRCVFEKIFVSVCWYWGFRCENRVTLLLIMWRDWCRNYEEWFSRSCSIIDEAISFRSDHIGGVGIWIVNWRILVLLKGGVDV
jgi:hypothetical protein